MDNNNYQIKVKGHLDDFLTGWFDGLTVSNLEDGDSILSGPLSDQAALHGVINKIRDLGLTLLAVSVETTIDQTNKKTLEK